MNAEMERKEQKTALFVKLCIEFNANPVATFAVLKGCFVISTKDEGGLW